MSGPRRGAWIAAALLAAGCGSEPASRVSETAGSRSLLVLGTDPVEPVGDDAEGRAPERAPLTLGDGDRATFQLEIAGDAELRFEAFAGGAGTLTVELRRLLPGDGTYAPAGTPTEIATGGGDFADAVALPPSGGSVLELRLAWSSSDRKSMGFGRLDVVEEGSESRPPVIFVSLDTLAAAHMSVYGYERRTTPNLEAFAREAVRFETCLANAPWTKPSYVSQFAGLLPESLRTAPNEYDWRIPRARWTLAEAFRGAGYRTAGFADNPQAGPAEGIAQGFELYDMSATLVPQMRSDSGILHILPRAKRWLADVAGGGLPWFLFVQAIDVHGPYLPAERFASAFADDGALDGVEPSRLPVEPHDPARPFPYLYGAIPNYIARWVPGTTDATRELPVGPIVDAYDAEVLALDDALGGFFEHLRAQGLWDRAIVVVSADHGETMLQHDPYFAHNHLYQEVLHVPLLVKLPGGRSGGTVVEEVVQLIDLYPTLVGLAGLEDDREWLHGRSLLPLLGLDAGAADLPDMPVISQVGLGRGVSVVYEGWKLIVMLPRQDGLTRQLTHPVTRAWLESHHPEFAAAYPVASDRAVFDAWFGDEADEVWKEVLALPEANEWRDELYHLETDPLETTNVAAEHPQKVEALRRLLAASRRLSDWTRARVPTEPQGVERTAEQKAALEDLGYAGD